MSACLPTFPAVTAEPQETDDAFQFLVEQVADPRLQGYSPVPAAGQTRRRVGPG